MRVIRVKMVVPIALLLLAASCGGGDSDPDQVQEAPTVVGLAEDGDAATQTPSVGADTAAPTVAGDSAAESPTPGPAFVGELPQRFCVSGVESTLNLRAAPTTESDVLASIPPSNCNLVSVSDVLDDNFRQVIYATAIGTTDGWVSDNFITAFQNPPGSIETAVLLFVDSWQRGLDTTQYSYNLGELPPIQQGDPVLTASGDESPSGCQLVGDVTVECLVRLVDSDGTQTASLSITGSQRGTNGFDGEPYFEADFPDGPAITGFTIN